MSTRREAWRYMCQFGKTGFTGTQLVLATESNNEIIRVMLREMLKEERIVIHEVRTTMLNHIYKVQNYSPLTRRVKKKVSRPKVLQRIWNTCRILKVFSLYDVQATAEAAASTSKQYLNALERAKIIRKIDTADGEIYRLNADLGPKHPESTPDGIKCPNRDKFYPFKERV